MKYILITLLIIFPSLLFAQTQVYLSADDGVISISYYGPINEQGASAFEKLLKQSNIRNLIISSYGGQVTEALKIGRLIKEYDMKVIVPPGGNCVSSCAFAVMASRDLSASRLYFHRSFFILVNADYTINDISRVSQRNILDMVEYFHSLDYSQQLLEIIYEDTTEKIFLVTDIEKLQLFREGFSVKLPFPQLLYELTTQVK